MTAGSSLPISAASSSPSVTSCASITTRSSSGSQASAIVPTRNSSSIGCSSGSSSCSSTGATAGTAAAAPWRSTSSSSSSRRSASNVTWNFSRPTLVTRRPARACRKKVRSPGWPTVPATNLSGMSYAMTGMRTTLRSATDRRVTVLAGLRKKIVDFPAVVIQADDEGPHLGVTDHRQRRRVGLDALDLVLVETERVRDDRLDDVAVAAHEERRVGLEAGVPLAYGRHRAVLGVGHRLTAGEPHRTGVCLDDLPEVLLGQVLQPPAGPVAVLDLAEPVVGTQFEAVAPGLDRLGGLLAALQRAGDEEFVGDRDVPGREFGGLRTAAVVLVHPGCPAGAHRSGHLGQPETHQEESCHVVNCSRTGRPD